jgi:hypothetical protein
MMRFSSHPFPPDKEGGIYAILDESGNVVPLKAEEIEMQFGKTPNIASNHVCGWTVLTTFQEALFIDDSIDEDWFETFVYTDPGQSESEIFKELAGQTHAFTYDVLAELYAPTLKQALANHAYGMRLARKYPRK